MRRHALPLRMPLLRLLPILLALFFLCAGCAGEEEAVKKAKKTPLAAPGFQTETTLGSAYGSYPYFKTVSWRRLEPGPDAQERVMAEGEFDLATMLHTAPGAEHAEGAAARMLQGPAKTVSPSALSMRYAVIFLLEPATGRARPETAFYSLRSPDPKYERAIAALPQIQNGILPDPDFEGLAMIGAGEVARAQVLLGTVALAARFHQ